MDNHHTVYDATGARLRETLACKDKVKAVMSGQVAGGQEFMQWCKEIRFIRNYQGAFPGDN